MQLGLGRLSLSCVQQAGGGDEAPANALQAENDDLLLDEQDENLLEEAA